MDEASSFVISPNSLVSSATCFVVSFTFSSASELDSVIALPVSFICVLALFYKAYGEANANVEQEMKDRGYVRNDKNNWVKK